MATKSIKETGRLERLITIAFLLSTRDEMHLDELAERIGSDRQELEKDLNVLMFCGLPPYSPEQLFDIIIEDDFVSMFFNDVFISPLSLNAKQKTQALIALTRLKKVESDANVAEICDELLELFDASNQQVVEIDVSSGPFDKLVEQALQENRVISIEYLSLNSADISTRKVIPRFIYNSASISYLFAFDEIDAKKKLFRMDRILSIEILGKSELKNVDDFFQIDNETSGDSLFMGASEKYVDFKIDEKAFWLMDSFPNEVVDGKSRVYRFYSNNGIFPARLLLTFGDSLEYVGGSLSREAIVEAIDLIEDQIESTRNAGN